MNTVPLHPRAPALGLTATTQKNVSSKQVKQNVSASAIFKVKPLEPKQRVGVKKSLLIARPYPDKGSPVKKVRRALSRSSTPSPLEPAPIRKLGTSLTSVDTEFKGKLIDLAEFPVECKVANHLDRDHSCLPYPPLRDSDRANRRTIRSSRRNSPSRQYPGRHFHRERRIR